MDFKDAIWNISAHHLGEQKTVLAVTDHGTASVTVSPLSYVCSLLNSSVYSNNQSVQNAMAALYKYFEAANALKKA